MSSKHTWQLCHRVNCFYRLFFILSFFKYFFFLLLRTSNNSSVHFACNFFYISLFSFSFSDSKKISDNCFIYTHGTLFYISTFCAGMRECGVNWIEINNKNAILIRTFLHSCSFRKNRIYFNKHAMEIMLSEFNFASLRKFNCFLSPFRKTGGVPQWSSVQIGVEVFLFASHFSVMLIFALCLVAKQ